MFEAFLVVHLFLRFRVGVAALLPSHMSDIPSNTLCASCSVSPVWSTGPTVSNRLDQTRKKIWRGETDGSQATRKDKARTNRPGAPRPSPFPPMASSSLTVLPLPPSSGFLLHSSNGPVRRRAAIVCKAKDAGSSGGGGGGGLEIAAAVGGLLSCPVIGVSLYTLKTTGCGLPPGPGGLFGAAEGVSYLVVAGVIGWSLYTKAKTGSGLPAGPYGLLGATEGLSYLAALAIIVVFGLQFLDRGYIPGPVPGDQCFG
ncbi:hypothetical protein Cni_G11768 [Canna indica]|uniref:Uncharacterized protein n=1 Tax=Canna indica TaxID=4628 RepID=A0AAQ3K6L9_9LILI|nr:hypothetical protein Cni_G11768 [Canna indica]